MFAVAATLALLAFITTLLVRFALHDGQKILAALNGQSWTAEPPMVARPVTVRMKQRYPVARPLRARSTLRAAA
jgi:hypothetical protein